jgi:lipid II:glycine glycyltransferase (peptidoglycan interpeptide bridge formation enzyme)
LDNGLVFCRIKSWLTGSRLVSLPFSDHCEPLCDSTEDLSFLIRYLQTSLERHSWKYLELRPINGNFGPTTDGAKFQPSTTFFLHRLALQPDLDELFHGLDKDSVQRRIHRAERAGLTETCGRSDALLKQFYSLFVITRSRHHLPPVPYTWFRNLVKCQGDALQLRLAYKDSQAIAAILTLRFRNTVYYKYGCSDAKFNQYGAVPLLLWRAITDGKSSGATEFDMGRTEEDNMGLLTFKNHWVPQPKRLVYWKFPEASSIDSVGSWKMKLAKQVFSHMPNRLLTLTGKLIYRHIG